MAYCRFSCDDFQCDVYCYESVDGGWQIYVARRKRIFKEPLPPDVPCVLEKFNEWFARYKEVERIVGEADLVLIGLPHDGEDYLEPSPEDAADRLELLRQAGYRVPQYAIDALREEAKEEAASSAQKDQSALNN